MNNYRYLFFITFLLALKVSAAQEVPKIRIDPSQAYGGHVSEYFNDVKYIPLETTKESLFGDVNQMVVTDSSIVIVDRDTRAVLFFTLEGRYIKKLSYKADEYPSIYMGPDGDQVFVMLYSITSGKSIAQNYGLTGRKLDTAAAKFIMSNGENLLPMGNEYFARFNYYYLSKDEEPKDSMIFLIDIIKNKSIYKSFFRINPKEYQGFCILAGGVRVGKKLNSTDPQLIYMPLEYKVFELRPDTLLERIQFVFPASISYPRGIATATNKALIDSLSKFNQTASSRIYSVSNIFYSGNRMFFKTDVRMYVNNAGSESGQQYNFIYDTLTGKLSSFERITPDETCFFLPLGGNQFTNMNGLIFKDGSFFATVSSLAMFAAREKTKHKAPQYPSVLKEYFATQSRKSNPVIVRMKLKE